MLTGAWCPVTCAEPLTGRSHLYPLEVQALEASVLIPGDLSQVPQLSALPVFHVGT